jgi:hypothetical protein
MANIILDEYQGDYIKKDGVCYYYIGETPSDITEDEIGIDTYISCETCLESENSSSSSSDSSQPEIENSTVSISSSSDSSDSDILSLSSDSSTPVMLACGTPNGDPTLFTTLSWIDADVTKDWLGCTFTNGETKEVYGEYEINPGTPTTAFEQWGIQQGTINNGRFGMSMFTTQALAGGINGGVVTIKGTPIGGINGRSYLYGSGSNTFSISTGLGGVIGFVEADMPYNRGSYLLLAKQKNNAYTDVNGVTYTWTEGNGW